MDLKFKTYVKKLQVSNAIAADGTPYTRRREDRAIKTSTKRLRVEVRRFSYVFYSSVYMQPSTTVGAQLHWYDKQI